MRRGPTERELDRALAALPRAGASPRFTHRVLAALAARPPAAAPRARRRWLVAGSAAALAVAALVVGQLARPAGEPAAAEVEALREEHRLLTEELAALRASLRARRPPVLYLGGTESLDLVLDLEPLLESGSARVRPAALVPGAGSPTILDPRPVPDPDGGTPR